jgi:hypothetical protein
MYKKSVSITEEFIAGVQYISRYGVTLTISYLPSGLILNDDALSKL